MQTSVRRLKRSDFTFIAEAARPYLKTIVCRWLPNGRGQGSEWLTRNPRRDDRTLGSFKVNLHTGRWADFATGHRGGDVISLAAYLFGLSQREAAYEIAQMLGLDLYGGHNG